MRYKLTIAYDGYNYYGFQKQTNKKTIEDTLLNAIRQIDNSVDKIVGSGRTDALVHAKGQVVHFDSAYNLKPYNWLKAINRFLPEDIRALKIEEVSADFHARFSAVMKEYRYYIQIKPDLFYRRYRYLVENLDIDLLKEAIKLYEGTHDFSGLASKQIPILKDRVKIIFKTAINCYNDYIELIFLGDGFLKYQVRKMVSLLIDIALGKKQKEDILITLEQKDPCLYTKLAPGWGLYLYKVYYGGKEDEAS